ncbi:DUF6130 family protein [Chitinophaga niabensis]|uniref:DUF4399 domain-containing protein n=1 Tax=Chitinophaga niabensis TaxID=536979 RepID=A0A1N6DD29_9BACT|nr:DUF6130 family protein [Chitinophaga niabensis]SIN68710.1 hypothetical protein SAMN04488055_0629 [Chitinophaga niabensis]
MKRIIMYLLTFSSVLAGMAQSLHLRTAAPVIALANEPAAKLVADAPLPASLAQGRVVIQYYAQNLRILPVYGSGALDVSPRIGHLHVTVDDAPWHWADGSNEPLIVNGLAPGPHHILLELADPTHKVIDSKAVSFVIPEVTGGIHAHHAGSEIHGTVATSTIIPAATPLTAREFNGPAPVVPLDSEPAPVLVVDQPLAEPLATGRVIVQYRTQHLRILPAFGTAALSVSPRIGHIHVTVDGGPWRWADSSNEPIIIVGMKPGPHKILVELVDPTHKTITQQTISFTVPEASLYHGATDHVIQRK